jgi:hypothetical protein
VDQDQETRQLFYLVLHLLTKYGVYCVVSTSSGQTTSLQSAVANSVYVRTLCCKAIAGSMGVTSVLNNNKVGNAVTISLGSAPSSWLSVSVIVLTGTAVFYPSAVNITAMSTSLSTSFGLVSTGSVGNVSLAISISGPASAEFGDSRLVLGSFRVLDATQKLDAPTLVSGTFSSDGLYITVAFSVQLTRG